MFTSLKKILRKGNIPWGVFAAGVCLNRIYCLFDQNMHHRIHNNDQHSIWCSLLWFSRSCEWRFVYEVLPDRDTFNGSATQICHNKMTKKRKDEQEKWKKGGKRLKMSRSKKKRKKKGIGKKKQGKEKNEGKGRHKSKKRKFPFFFLKNPSRQGAIQ